MEKSNQELEWQTGTSKKTVCASHWLQACKEVGMHGFHQINPSIKPSISDTRLLNPSASSSTACFPPHEPRGTESACMSEKVLLLQGASAAKQSVKLRGDLLYLCTSWSRRRWKCQRWSAGCWGRRSGRVRWCRRLSLQGRAVGP